MIVAHHNFDEVIRRLEAPGKRGLDTETTGLKQDDRLFSLIIACEDETYYFNFNRAPDTPPTVRLDRAITFGALKPIFLNPLNTWYIQNAKFDLRMLANEGVEIVGRVHCTYAVERVIKNNYFGENAYRLEGMAPRYGGQKDKAVEEYIEKHKLYTRITVPGKKKIIKIPHFDKVPFPVISAYGERDAQLHRIIGIRQEDEVAKTINDTRYPPLTRVFENEVRLTKTCYRMERRGITVDRPYVAKALEYEIDQIRASQEKFREHTGHLYEDSSKLFKEIFDKAGEKYPLTEKGNPSFAADVLEEMDSPVAALINTIRYHGKRASTYYSSFLHLATQDDILHADIRQAGTETGRFSYRDPNLQNVPKEDEGCDDIPYLIRRSFIPRQNHLFYSIDYNQQEFRMMLDWAGELKLIKEINDGADVHQATADLCGITRRQAKTINFGLLYGMGKRKLAKSLGVSEREAHELICVYFARLPRVKPLISAISRAGEARGFIFNWFGRRCHISEREWSYILPNHFIQGGCADVIKVAMNAIDDYLLLNERKTMMLLQVHDELLIEAPFDEERIVEKLRDIMEKVYQPQNGMRLTTAVEHSFKSWSARDKIKGVPYAKA